MKCPRCNKKIKKNDFACPNCGWYDETADDFSLNSTAIKSTKIQNVPPKRNYVREVSALAICAIFFSFIIPIVGFILGVVGHSTYYDERYKKYCKIAILISIACVFVPILLKYIISIFFLK